MLPVLEPTDVTAAFEPARDLGLAFQLTNFLRDVGEDLDRGRVYLPQEDLDRFGADPWSRQVTPAWRQLMEFEIARARSLYASADRGIEWLPPRSAACVRAARVLYSRILLEIERNGYDVFATRARVSTPRKLVTAARYLGGGVIGSRKP
jgi:15-cis-phytoene synthase